MEQSGKEVIPMITKDQMETLRQAEDDELKKGGYVLFPNATDNLDGWADVVGPIWGPPGACRQIYVMVRKYTTYGACIRCGGPVERRYVHSNNTPQWTTGEGWYCKNKRCVALGALAGGEE